MSITFDINDKSQYRSKSPQCSVTKKTIKLKNVTSEQSGSEILKSFTQIIQLCEAVSC